MTRLLLTLVIAFGLAFGSASDLLAKGGLMVEAKGEARAVTTAVGRVQAIKAASIRLLMEGDTANREPQFG